MSSWGAWVDLLTGIEGVAAGGIWKKDGDCMAQTGFEDVTPEDIANLARTFDRSQTSAWFCNAKYIKLSGLEASGCEFVQLRCKKTPLCVFATATMYIIVKGEEEAQAGEIADEVISDVWTPLANS